MTKPNKETRILTFGKLEIRAGGKGKMLAGYSAMFNKESEDMGFIEKIAPGAFKRALEEKQDVRALFNHDPNFVLGRSTAGTLRLTEDDTGLWMECDLPDTTAGRDVMESISRGDITGQSFSFCCMGEKWEMPKEGAAIRTLTDCDLFDVGPVTFPAYPDTTVAARSLDKFKLVSKEAYIKALKLRSSQIELARRK